jgi:uncharacterized damage-inducible protein DinB
MIKATPWIERKFEFSFPVGLFPVIIERLRGTAPRLEALIREAEEEILSYKPGDKWSVKEIIGHLYDLESLWMGRIDDFLAGKETLRAADMTNAKTKAAGHNEKKPYELLKMFSEVRTNLIEKVKDMDEQTASITALHPRLQTPMRLIDSLFFAAEHDDHELTKIRALITTSS